VFAYSLFICSSHNDHLFSRTIISIAIATTMLAMAFVPDAALHDLQ